MNKTDTIVAKGLLYIISFAVIYKLTEVLIGLMMPSTASMYPLGVYAVSAAIALVAAVVPVKHFFPGA